MARHLSILITLAAATAACQERPKEQAPEAAKHRLSARPDPTRTSSAALLERQGTGRVAYLGADVPSGPLRPGDVIDLVHYFEVKEPLRGDYAVVVDLKAPGSELGATDAHRPMEGLAPSNTWKKGEIWADRHRLRIGGKLRSQKLELLVSLADAGQRLTVEAPPGASDGSDRVRVALLDVDLEGLGEPEDGLPRVTIPRAKGPIKADGVIDEAAWSAAPIMGFSDSMGREGAARLPTKLRLLYDDENLYVAFDAIDEDISDPYAKRDDPIYDHETVEVFIMPNVVAPALGPYVELQASPKGVIFDAAFTARRQGMDKSFDAGQTVGTKLDGTLNDPSDKDRGWVSEWIVPWRGLRGVERAPKPGEEWRMNAFRIEKHDAGGKLEGEYTAWSPPRVGDFHATDRFGRMRFGP
jgi:hypothetical protein